MHQPDRAPESPATPRARPVDAPPAGVLAAAFAGGVVGASARIGLSALVPAGAAGFPWPTLIANLSGAFLLGAALSRWSDVGRARPERRAFFCTGVLGSFTTFSALAVETLSLGSERAWLAGLYAGGSVLAGLAAAWAGSVLGRGRAG